MILLVSENMPTPCILNFKEFLSSTEPFRPNPQLKIFNMDTEYKYKCDWF